MKPINQFIFLTVVMLLFSCTYDRTLIYHKDYIPGEHQDLKIDGYYNKSTPIVTYSESNVMFMKPIFFYADGSVVFTGNVIDTATLRARISPDPTKVWGMWGNYQIVDDTIKIETIGTYSNHFHHSRNTLVGLIYKDSIEFLHYVDRKGNIDTANYVVHYTSFNIKPDSTSNWIRTKRKFNR